ncbi:carboxymuconolactone decarboxylase family protein [Leifsonia soli]|uniref:4-carboxymuconolactone decarboxylase n=1 Tax=Leifsonia soli TaxID=582665 RepID=A0A852T0P2_9MICO|nr:carboxymuconolactone decarboxylase family protein [Leifsonia soli]NYD75106.1 4-carboxymuconolactone decarboxylase [Leifsonia soli]
MHLNDPLDQRVAAGRAVYARNLGVTPEEAERVLSDRAGEQYANEAFVAAGGPGWNGTDLTDRDRTIAVIAALVGQHVTDQRLTTYLDGARSAGVTDQGLAELMVLLTAYLGQPAPSAAMAAIRATAEQDPHRSA